MGTGNLLNPSWSGGDGMGGGGFGDGGSSGTSYYYGTGIGQPVPGESYGNFQYLSTSLEYTVGSYGERVGRLLRNFHYLDNYNLADVCYETPQKKDNKHCIFII